MDLTSFTIESARSAIRERRTTAVTLAEAHFAKIESDDPQIGAYLTLAKETALARAAEIDARAAKGEALPPLAGVPVAIKDVIVTRGLRPRPARKFWEITFLLTTALLWRGWKPLAPWSLVRRIATNLPWDRRMKILRGNRCTIRVT